LNKTTSSNVLYIQATNKQGVTMSSFSTYKFTCKITGSVFIGQYCGGPTVDVQTGEVGKEICLKSKDGKYKWCKTTDCIKQN